VVTLDELGETAEVIDVVLDIDTIGVEVVTVLGFVELKEFETDEENRLLGGELLVLTGLLDEIEFVLLGGELEDETLLVIDELLMIEELLDSTVFVAEGLPVSEDEELVGDEELLAIDPDTELLTVDELLVIEEPLIEDKVLVVAVLLGFVGLLEDEELAEDIDEVLAMVVSDVDVTEDELDELDVIVDGTNV
jgi:hypothetical protein